MNQTQSRIVIASLLVGSIALIWNGCSSFRDSLDRSAAELFAKDQAPCQVLNRMNDTPIATRQTKYGLVCAD